MVRVILRGDEKLGLRQVLYALALLLLLLFGYWHYVVLPLRGRLLDFSIYLEAAQRFARGETVYGEGYPRIIALTGRRIEMFYLYPPFLMVLLSDFLFLPEQTLKVIWCWLNYFALLGSAVFVIAALRNTIMGKLNWLTRIVLGLALLFCFEPVFAGALEGQANALVMLLLGIFVYGLAQNRGLTAGMALSLAAAIKVTPAFLLLVSLAKRDLRILGGFALGALAVTAFVFLNGVSFTMLCDFFARLVFLSFERAPGGAFNFSSVAALLGPLGLESMPAARIILITGLLSGAFLAMLFWNRDSQLFELRAAAFLICIMTMLAPLIWYHHFSWLIIPLAVVSLQERSDKASQLRLWTLSLGLYLLISKSFLINTYALLSGSSVLMHMSLLLPTLCMGVMMWLLWSRRPRLKANTEVSSAAGYGTPR